MTPANDKNTMTYDELIQQAEEHYNEYKCQSAVECATQAIDLDAARPDGYYLRGVSYRRLHKQEEMLKDADALLEYTSNTVKALHLARRGWAYNVKGESEKAVDACTEALKKDDKEKEAYRYRAWAYLEMGKKDEAIADCDKAIEIDNSYAAAYNCRGIAYSNKGGCYKDAVANYTDAIKLDPKYAAAYVNRGDENKEKGNHKIAIKDYDQAVKIDPNYAIAYNNRGEVYHLSKNCKRAILDCNRAIELDPKYVDAYNLCGDAYREIQNYGKAIEKYVKAVELDPKCDSIYRDSLYIDPFLNTVKMNGEEIGNEIKEWLCKSPDDLVCLVGEILATIQNKEVYTIYIELVQMVQSLLHVLENKTKELLEIEPRKLFHQYRKSKESLEAIRKKGVILLTPACYANDPDEGKHIFKFLSFSSKNKLEELLIEQSKDEDTGSGTPIAFIRSFSEPRDDLQMWNSSYAGNGSGYSVGVPLFKFKASFNRPPHTFSMDAKDSEAPELSMEHTPSPQNNEDKKDVKLIPMERLYFARVLYLSPDKETKSCQDDSAYLTGIGNALERFTDAYLAEPNNVQHFKNFLPRIFLPIAHLVKSADYQHEKEWRLLYCTSIKNDIKTSHHINDKPIRDKGEPTLHIETEEILFKDPDNKEEILLGPTFGEHLEMERLRIQHLFEYDGIDDCVEIKTSKKHFRG